MSQAPLEKRVISAPRVGMFNAHIQGDLKHSQFVILTLHDLGCNHTMWLNFLSNPSMEEINRRGAFIHVDVPGQEDEAPDLPAETVPGGKAFGGCGNVPRHNAVAPSPPLERATSAKGLWNRKAAADQKDDSESTKQGHRADPAGENKSAAIIEPSQKPGADANDSFRKSETSGPGKPKKDLQKSRTTSSYAFPSMQSLGEDLVCVLDQLDVKQVICVGEGAGANIVARFAMSQPERVLGCVLIHCTGTTAGVMESLKDKVMNWKLEQIGMNPSTEAYLCLHRFGSINRSQKYFGVKREPPLHKTTVKHLTHLFDEVMFEKAENREQLQKVIESFQQSLRSKINPKNLKRFVQAFMKRSNIADQVGKLKCRVLMVTGSNASFNHTVHNMFAKMRERLDKMECDILEVDGVANVLEEKPERFAESLLYFLQGMGLVGGVPMPRVQRSSSIDSSGTPPQRNRSMSMEEADMPRGIYSMSPPKNSGSPMKGSAGDGLSTSPIKS